MRRVHALAGTPLRTRVTIGSLFSGIGGLELGLEWAGLGPVVFQCEIVPFCRAVLAKHWPNAVRFDDVTRPRDWPHVDLICGGFPCTDVSSAGKRRGLGGERSGLWYYFARIVRQVRPRLVVVENVASGARRWLPYVRHQLHVLGYGTRALGIAASDCGAPHRRSRVFVVAHARGERSEQRDSAADPHHCEQLAITEHAEMGGASPHAADDADSARRAGSVAGAAHEGWPRSSAEPWRPPIGGLVPVVHGLSGGLAGRRRRERIRALGNAVVPQCAQIVGEIIISMLRATEAA